MATMTNTECSGSIVIMFLAPALFSCAHAQTDPASAVVNGATMLMIQQHEKDTRAFPVLA
jgi:hypothetical protein